MNIRHRRIVPVSPQVVGTPGRVIIRWPLQSGLIVIATPVTPTRIDENAKVFDFERSVEQMSVLGGLDRKDRRIGPNPMTADF